jgi:hypothetical protein
VTVRLANGPGRGFNGVKQLNDMQLPVIFEDLGERTLSLPLSPDLSEDDVSDVCPALAHVLRYYTSESELHQLTEERTKKAASKHAGVSIQRKRESPTALP